MDPYYESRAIVESAYIQAVAPVTWAVEGEGLGWWQMDRSNEVQLCVVSDVSGSVAYVVMLPLAAAAFIVILVPLLTSWRLQVLAKILGLFFLILSLLTSESELLRYTGGQNSVPNVSKSAHTFSLGASGPLERE